MDSLGSTYTKRRTVYETYAGTFPPKHLLYKDCKWNSYGLLKFNKTIIRHYIWK